MRRLVICILLISFILAGCSRYQTYNNKEYETPIATHPSSTHKETDNPVQTPSTEPSNDAEETGDITKVGISNNNISSIGDTAYDGDYYYIGAISHPWNDDLYDEGFWRISCDGTKIDKISDDKPIYINIIGDSIYYIKHKRYNNGSMVRIKNDGSNRQMILDGNNTKMLVVGDWIYFINNDDRNIYKISIEGEKLTRIVDGNCFNLQYNNSWLYYSIYDKESKISTLYKIDVNSCKNPIKLIEGNWELLILYEDWIYYTIYSENGMFRIKEDGSEKEQLFSMNVYSFGIADNKIYFISDNEQYYTVLYEMDLEGENIKEMVNDPSLYLSDVGVIAGNYIYYDIYEGEWTEIGRVNKDGSENIFLRDLLKDYIYKPQ